MQTLLQIFDKKLKDILTKLNFSYDENKEIVQKSNRPDLSDFQCNEALRLAKIEGKNPREIAQQIADKLSDDLDIESFSIDGPGFINIKTSAKLLKEQVFATAEDEKLGYYKEERKKIVVEFSSPNVAKPMHVGHLRSVIGESLKRIMKFAGDDIIADNHLGDWGKPYGLTIAETKREMPNLPYFDDNFKGEYPKEAPITEEDLGRIYPSASKRAKKDESFNQEALKITAEMQAGHKGYRAILKHFREITIKSLEKTYKELDISFDTWYGESFYNDMALEMITDLESKGFIKEDQGAKIIPLKRDTDKKEFPPLIMEKSGGGIMYGTTDMATVKYRLENQGADGFIILTDPRQGIHFEQFFRAAEITGILKPEHTAEHLSFGMINGPDNKPFKTRDGGVMKLNDLINETKSKVMELLKDRDTKGEDKNELARRIGVSALKFSDMSNDIKSNYIFDLNKILSFEGKTGPYILYTYVRLNSILNKVKNNDSTGFSTKEANSSHSKLDLESHIKNLQEATNDIERKLMLHITTASEAINKAYTTRSPHHLCDFIYELSSNFNTFYRECHIANEEDETIKNHRIALLHIVKKELETIGELIGLEFVKVM